jgi:hypothetical protein|tara:strand:- start:21 stop:218 length:198 start_codon:yes stop_codon:yes gene_type:complete
MIKPEWTWMYFNEEWNQTKDNKIGLKSYMCNIDKEEEDDESTYVDGVDERPKPKQVEYNDDDYDY